MVRGITSGVAALAGAVTGRMTSDGSHITEVPKGAGIDIIDDATTGMSERREHIMMKRAGLAGATELSTYRGPAYNSKVFKNKYMPHDGGGKKATAKHRLRTGENTWVHVTPEMKDFERRYRKRHHFVG